MHPELQRQSRHSGDERENPQFIPDRQDDFARGAMVVVQFPCFFDKRCEERVDVGNLSAG